MENGDFRPPVWGSVTPEPIELKFGMIDYFRHPTPHAKMVAAGKGGWGGVWVKLSPRVLFSFFLSF